MGGSQLHDILIDNPDLVYCKSKNNKLRVIKENEQSRE